MNLPMTGVITLACGHVIGWEGQYTAPRPEIGELRKCQLDGDQEVVKWMARSK